MVAPFFGIAIAQLLAGRPALVSPYDRSWAAPLPNVRVAHCAAARLFYRVDDLSNDWSDLSLLCRIESHPTGGQRSGALESFGIPRRGRGGHSNVFGGVHRTGGTDPGSGGFYQQHLLPGSYRD